MLKDLVKLADILDEKGFHMEAESIDNIIKTSGDMSSAVKKFIDALKGSFQRIATNKSVFPLINEKSLPEILQVIDILAENGSFLNPTMQDTSWMSDINSIAQGILALSNDYELIEKELSSEKDDDVINDLYRELENINRRLSKLYETVNTFKDGRRPGDKDKYEKIKQIVNSRLGREVL